MIRKNGFFGGGRIVLGYWMTFVRSLFAGSGDILFVTGGVGDSAHYRAYNQTEELRHHGFQCSTTSLDNPFLSKYADKFKIFIFHRTIITSGLTKLMEKIKKQKKEIIFDTDDLVYDPQFLCFMDYFKNMSHFEKRLYQNGIGGEIVADPYVKVCTTTTQYLSQKLEEKGKKVYISKNKISDHELEIAENILRNIPKVEDEYIRIGYFSGTHSHNKDFAVITEALMAVLGKYKNAKLILAGPLDIENKLNIFKSRIEILPRVSRDKYYENIWKVDINLAPLEKDNPFCESKSEIKFTETGILRVPTIAVKNQTFSQVIFDGENGFLADNTDEWVEKIGKLIEEENLRKTMGEKAREKVLRDYTNKNSHNEEYYNYLKSRL
ncbi:MAG: glycosyltransferase [Parcubacteria group bacterium]